MVTLGQDPSVCLWLGHFPLFLLHLFFLTSYLPFYPCTIISPSPSLVLTLCLGSVVVETMTELQMVRARKKSAMADVVEWEDLGGGLASDRVSSHRAASWALVSRFLSGVTSFSWKTQTWVSLWEGRSPSADFWHAWRKGWHSLHSSLASGLITADFYWIAPCPSTLHIDQLQGPGSSFLPMSHLLFTIPAASHRAQTLQPAILDFCTIL